MSAAEVDPSDLLKPVPEALLDALQGVAQVVATAFAVAVAVQSFDAFWEGFGQVSGQHAEAASRCAGIVDFGFDGRSLGVDAQSATHPGTVVAMSLVPFLHAFGKACVLCQAVEADVAGATEDVAEGFVLIGGGIGVCARAEFLKGKACLPW